MASRIVVTATAISIIYCASIHVLHTQQDENVHMHREGINGAGKFLVCLFCFVFVVLLLLFFVLHKTSLKAKCLLNLLHAVQFSMLFCRLLIFFFKIRFFRNIF